MLRRESKFLYILNYFIFDMSFYIHKCLLSVKISNFKVRRICVIGLTNNSIVLSCFGKILSIIGATSGPILEYILYKKLEERFKSYLDIIKYYTENSLKIILKLYHLTQLRGLKLPLSLGLRNL